jgi:acetaldehyde dehydrogenase (acetylating)
MATSFSGGRSRRELLTMGKQLVNFITCGGESSVPLFVIYTTKTGRHDIAEILLKVALNTKNKKNLDN